MTLSPHHYQTNRLELLSRLAGDISHEIKNPLHAMVINLELVRRKIEKGEPAPALERVAIVEDEIRKVHALTNALLEALRPPRDSNTTCSFHAILQEMEPLVSARARLARVELQLEVEPIRAIVPMPAHELRLLILNLADRAVRTAGSGGAIDVSVAGQPEHVELTVLSANPTLDAVEDGWLNDHPVDVEHIDLGLRVVRALVDHVGGRIHTSRASDGRHRFSLTLPAASA